MRRFDSLLISTVFIGACFCAPAAFASAQASSASSATADAAPLPQRIVSLAPSVTEVLFGVGLGPRVVGVTDWCKWPPQAAGLPSVGGHIDPNYEAVAALDPDLVVLETIHTAAAERLTALDIPMLAVEHRTVAGILESITAIGRRCGADSTAAELRREMESRLDAVRRRVADKPRPRALVVVGRTLGEGRVGDVYVAGGGTFLGELLDLAGGENAYGGRQVKYPTISAEGLLRLDPDIIIELAPEYADSPERKAELEAAWTGMEGMSAAESGQVMIFTDGWMLLPGPRCVAILERFADVLHPETRKR